MKLVSAALLLIALVGAGLVFVPGFLEPTLDPKFEARLVDASDDEIDRLVTSEAERLGVTALSIAVFDEGGAAETRTFGRASEDGLMQAASLSKAVAAAVILIVAESESVSLDDDIRPQVTSLDIAALEGGDRPVTLRQLLSHTTGASQSGYRGYPRSHELPSTAEIIASPPRFFQSPLAFDGTPGEFRYSGGGYSIAQLWAEDVTGKDFAEIADELLLAPLGMKTSTFAQPINASLKIVGADAGFAPHRAIFASIENSWYNYPEKAAAGLWTTAEEYGVFARALVEAAKGNETAIPVSVAKAMLTPVVTPDWASDTATTRYGLGVVLELDERGDVISVSHSGGNTGYKSYFTAIPQTGQVVVSMANTENSSPLNVAIVEALIER